MKNATEQQTIKLVATLVEHNKLFTKAPTEQVQWAIQNPADAVSLFCHALIARANGVAAKIDSVVRVDRPVKPIYPDWVEKVLHPELENTGPAEYDVAKLELWLHEDQKGGKRVKGQMIYEYLKEKKMLESCLGLSDLFAIQAKDIAFFRQHFRGKVVFGWKSVVRLRGGLLIAPCLCEDGGQVVLSWICLEHAWRGRSPALRLAS